MGANMARRLKDQGFTVTAVYDRHANPPRNSPRNSAPSRRHKLADVTAAADVIITVVTDDEAMDAIFVRRAATRC